MHQSVNRYVTSCFIALLITSSPAVASPTMVRVGYTACLPCHVSPQGGGLLTDYGKGVDLAQSLRLGEYVPPPAGERPRLIQDLRGQLGVSPSVNMATGVWSTAQDARLWHRATFLLSSHHRFSSVVAVDLRPSGASSPKIAVPRITYDYRVNEGVELTVGKDVLPSGIGLPDYQAFGRDATEPGVAVAPSQVKLFMSKGRLSATPYVFAPGGEELVANRARGGGFVGGVDVWKQHAVLGVTAKQSDTATTRLRTTGVFARVGFGKWGVLTEHDVVLRHEAAGSRQFRDQYVQGTMVFAAPREWLVASLNSQLSTAADPGGYVHKIGPTVQVRISDRATIVASEREILGDSTRPRRRSVGLQLFLKTVN